MRDPDRRRGMASSGDILGMNQRLKRLEHKDQGVGREIGIEIRFLRSSEDFDLLDLR